MLNWSSDEDAAGDQALPTPNLNNAANLSKKTRPSTALPKKLAPIK
jgi:hypothetical protein